MSWDWLKETLVLFVSFIAMLIGIPASVAFIVQFVRPVVRRAMSRRAKKPAVQPVLMGASSISHLASSPTRTITFGSEGEKKPAVRSGATVSLTPPRKTGGAFPTVGSVGRVASMTSASNPTTTITWKSASDLYEAGLGQPTPWDGHARGGVAVYPGGL